MGNENSGNPNPPQTEEFLEKAKATQFGGARANPRYTEIEGARKPYDIRNALQHLSGQEIDPEKLDTELARVKKMINGRRNPTMAQLLALRYYEKALKKAPDALFDKIIEQTHGKLWQPNLNADLEALAKMSDEELYERENASSALLREVQIMGEIARRKEAMDQLRQKQTDFQAPILPPAFDELWKPHRYKIFYGGRGGGKTHSFARALITYAHKQKERILCTRQFQNTIKDSVHQVLCDAIALMNLGEYFYITDSSIRHKLTGSEFIFKGLKYAPREIKSTEGVTKVWLAEAQSATKESLRALFPTIRTRGSEIWAEFNTEDDKDPIYDQFIAHTHPHAYVRLVNFDENPYFNPDPANPTELEMERQYTLGLIAQAKDDEERAQAEADYDNIWLGAIRKLKASAIFRGKVIFEDFETPAGTTFYHGADWGFGADPTCLTRWWQGQWKGRRALFIDYEAFGYGLDIEKVPALFERIPTARKWKIYADNSRPETISYVKRKGFNIEGAEKWDGSIEDGIEYMRGFEVIVIHTRCPHIKLEAKNYCHKIDKQTGEILPDIVDAWNHGWDSGRYALFKLIKKRPKGFFDVDPA